MPNIKSIEWMISKVEGRGPISSPPPSLMPSSNFFYLMPFRVKLQLLSFWLILAQKISQINRFSSVVPRRPPLSGRYVPGYSALLFQHGGRQNKGNRAADCADQTSRRVEWVRGYRFSKCWQILSCHSPFLYTRFYKCFFYKNARLKNAQSWRTF